MSIRIKKVRRAATIALAVGALASCVWIIAPPLLARLFGHGGRLTISHETTVVTEPLRDDGTVDYIAALNKILSDGVTLENNALVPFWNAMGPATVPEADRAEYFRLLRMRIPATDGNYFVPLKDYVAAHPTTGSFEVIDKQLGDAQARPWKKSEFPIVAAWLDANQAPLEAVITASRRSRYYSPLVGDASGTLMSVKLPATEASRHVTHALVARAMLRLGDGNTEGCWQDLLATHRWARLCGQGFCLVDAMVAITIDAAACRGDQAICQGVRLSAAGALRMRDELGRLAPLPSIAAIVDRGERWSVLSSVCQIARGDGTRTKGPIEKLGDDLTRNAIDWDIPLRITNLWFDKAMDVLRKPTAIAQRAAFDEFEKQLRAAFAAAPEHPSLSLLNFRRGFSEQVGQRIATLLFPAVEKANDVGHTAETRIALVKLSFSLAAYRADHGVYPAELAVLVPKYAPAIPLDIFSGAALHYVKKGNGYLLYSVGRNGKDDGGKGYDDRGDGSDGDDIAVRVEKGP